MTFYHFCNHSSVGDEVLKRAGNNPRRRIAPADSLTVAQRTALTKKVAYVASGHHKRNPADYGLERTNPRPTKSLCDRIRIIPLKEAKSMIARGISFGMVSDYAFGEFPKFIWCVSDDDVYEAKTDETTPGTYHGYRLEEEDNMRVHVKKVWKERCQPAGR
jgi:hypothetical protein